MGSRDRTEQAARKYCPSGASGACSHFWLCRLSQRLPWHWLQSEPYPECLEPAGAASRSAAARWHFQANPLLPPAARQPPASTPGTSGTCCKSCRLSQCPAAVAGGLLLARGRCERTATLRPTPRPIDKPRPGWQMATAADQQTTCAEAGSSSPSSHSARGHRDPRQRLRGRMADSSTQHGAEAVSCCRLRASPGVECKHVCLALLWNATIRASPLLCYVQARASD